MRAFFGEIILSSDLTDMVKKGFLSFQVENILPYYQKALAF